MDESKLERKYQELYYKSLFMGIGTAVNFVIQMGDELSTSDCIELSRGKIPDGYAQYGFGRLLEGFPQLEKNGDEYNFCLSWFYVGIGVAVAFMERELNK